MARVLSGIQPTGDKHLGNLLGAIRHWVATQDADDCLYCVVDLHAMTVPYEPAALAEATRRTATVLLAAGLDPKRCTLFVQSHVPQHTELTWILNCVANVGELNRMTQFKEKSEGRDSVSAGLFDYPVLMAADILLYDTERVPVGDDQRQHLELARDLAGRFNHRFGDTLVVPEAAIPPVAARVMDLQHPTAKMSTTAPIPPGHHRAPRPARGHHEADPLGRHRLGHRRPLRPRRQARRLEPAADPRRHHRSSRSRPSRPSTPTPATAR